MSKRKRWYSFSAHIDSNRVSSSVDFWEVVETVGLRERVVHTADSFEAAEDWIQDNIRANIRHFYSVRGVGEQTVLRRGQALAPIQPLPLFETPATILTTRGFWDVTLDVLDGTTRVRSVANFAFGLLVMPIKPAYLIEETLQDDIPVRSYRVNRGAVFPDILLDDAGWFVHESFARITETENPVSFDPPFHSKARRKIPAGSAIMCVLGYDINLLTETANVANLTFGARFRVLVED